MKPKTLKLSDVFTEPPFTQSTIRLYTKWCNRLCEFFPGRPISTLTKTDLNQFFAQLAYDEHRKQKYSRGTTNQAKIAANHLLAYVGNSNRAETVSTRSTQQIPDILSVSEATCTIAALPDYYRPIAEMMYNEFTPPGAACAAFDSRVAPLDGERVAVHQTTFNKHIKAAAKRCGVVKTVNGKLLQQSGIVHAIRAGVDRDVVLQGAGITAHQLAWYEGLA